MSTPVERLHENARLSSPGDAQVGRTYDVPCVRIVDDTVFPNEFLRIGEYVPVFLPAHEDAEYFDFPHLHYHIDFRFVSADLWQRMTACTSHVHACIVTISLVSEAPKLQSLECRQMMPDFPAAPEIAAGDAEHLHDALVRAVRGLERHYRTAAIDTATLICPHRGVCLKGLPVAAGIVVCPAHGLAWNVGSGALVPRHSRRVTNGGAAVHNLTHSRRERRRR